MLKHTLHIRNNKINSIGQKLGRLHFFTLTSKRYNYKLLKIYLKKYCCIFYNI